MRNAEEWYTEHMPLNLYRRHYDKGRCFGGHQPNTQTYESDEFRPKHKKCGCPIYASGKLGNNPKFRRNTRRFTWIEARGVAEAWERNGGIETPVPPDPPPLAPIPSPGGKSHRTIAEAIEITLKENVGNDSSLATVRRYKTVLGKFHQFSTDIKGYLYLDQWTVEDVKQLRRWWKGSVRYHQKNFSFLRSFFNIHRQYITENPVDLSRLPRNRKHREASQLKQKSPYTNEELDRMITACDRYPNFGGPQKFFGADVSDFIRVSLYTGLRISDVATFHVSRMAGNGNIHVRAIKNGKWVDTWVPQWLEDIIWARAEKWGPYIFGARQSEDPVVLGTTWRTRLNTLWALCEPFNEKPTHHRFRHTFARILLQNGTPVGDVADLLGDTEAVVRQSYSKWVPERQDRLSGVLRDAFAKAGTPLYRVK